MRLSWIVTQPVFSVTVTLGCLATAAIYGMAAARVPRWSSRRTGAFLAGLAVIAFALESGIGANDDRLLSAHMIEHLLLLDVAPPLLLLGWPVRLLLLSLSRRRRLSVGRALVRIGHRVTPLRCLALYTIVLLGLHVPVVFTAAIRHPILHALEHVAFVAAGAVLWWPLLGSPNPRRVGAVGHLLYLTAAMVPMTLIGAYLDRATSLFYPLYAAPARALGISALADQQTAGAIMWVAGTAVMGLAGLASAMAALTLAERRQQARELHGVLP